MTKILIGYFILGIIFTFFLLEIRNKCFIKNNSKTQLQNNILKLVRQSARWSTAAKQDKNPLIAVLHSNYGAGYLWALKEIASNDQIEQAANIDISKFENEIINVQDQITKRLIHLCPNFAPEKSYLAKIAGEG